MNALPPGVEESGLVAYEQARAFEAVQRRNLPLIYVALTLLLIMAGGVMLKVRSPIIATLCFAGAVGFPWLAWLNWQRLKARHAMNLHLLADLENRYGDQLPWLQVERHLAALGKLEAELAAEGSAGGPADNNVLNKRPAKPAQERPDDLSDTE